MTDMAGPISRLLNLGDGGIAAPAALEAMLQQLDASGTDLDLHDLEEATERDFGDVPDALRTLATARPDEQENLAHRLAWTIEILENWDHTKDRLLHRLEAALASASRWNAAGDFWEAIRRRSKVREITMEAFSFRLNHRAAEATPAQDAPIWEREHLEATRKAEREGDWAELGERVLAYPDLPFMDGGAREAMRALTVLNRPMAVRLADSTGDWLRACLLVEALHLVEALRLGATSVSGHVRFAVIDRLRRELRRLTPIEQGALTRFLIVLAKAPVEWPKWLAIFNRYPVRYPHIQIALGHALARADVAALDAYINSIELGVGDRPDDDVARCLAAFRTRAPASRRETLWRGAFRRWQAWNFSEGKNDVGGICRSELDYGVIGWLVEFAGHTTSATVDGEFEQEFERLENRWHASITQARSAFFRLLSRHQLYAHSALIGVNDGDWLPLPKIYVPKRADDPYVRRRYSWED